MVSVFSSVGSVIAWPYFVLVTWLRLRWKKWIRGLPGCYTRFPPINSSIICKSHFIEAQRHHDDPNFTPKWKSSLPRPLGKCGNPKCTFQEKLIKPVFLSPSELEKLLGVSPSPDSPSVLCQQCYNALYHQLHPPNSCASCVVADPEGFQGFHETPFWNWFEFW